MYPGKIGACQDRPADRSPFARQETDHACRQARLAQNLHDDPGAVGLGRRWFPQYRVAHNRGRGRQVSGDRCEIERRHRENKAFQRPVVHGVPHAIGGFRLHRVKLFHEMHVETPEIHQLAGGVYFRLENRFALAEHGRRIDLVAIRPGKQVGRLQKNCRAVFPVHRSPMTLHTGRCRDGERNFFFPGFVVSAQQMTVIVRRPALRHLAGVNFALPDHDRNLQLLVHHGGETGFQRGALCAPWCKGADSFVERRGCTDYGTGHAFSRIWPGHAGGAAL
ncbi:hypothetical protein MnTg04_00910 [bacterium MnTg04]|nr:hypothetical protein MnTg04_00910 [bacterium MnTg04]